MSSSSLSPLRMLLAVLKYASANNIPVYTRAAGTGHTGACVPVHRGILISMMRMNQILEINPSDGVAIVQPGVITGELQRAVREHGWYYPPDPASLKECSIGGNIATNAGGPRCLKYGVTKQYALGLETVLASGEVLRSGGRCHKNSTGFDLTSLMVGSEGMLGIVTEITVRLIPHPQSPGHARRLLCRTSPPLLLRSKPSSTQARCPPHWKSLTASPWQPLVTISVATNSPPVTPT